MAKYSEIYFRAEVFFKRSLFMLNIAKFTSAPPYIFFFAEVNRLFGMRRYAEGWKNLVCFAHYTPQDFLQKI